MPELLSLSDAKTWLGVTGTGSDTLITALLDEGEAVLRDLCDRPLGWTKAERTELIDGNGGDTITVACDPIDTAATVTVVVSGSTVPSSQYEVGEGSIRLKDSSVWMFTDQSLGALAGNFAQRRPAWPVGLKNISVTYTGGYTTAPLVLVQAMRILVASAWADRSGNAAISEESLGQYRYVLRGRASVMDDVSKLVSGFVRGAGL